MTPVMTLVPSAKQLRDVMRSGSNQPTHISRIDRRLKLGLPFAKA